MAKFKYRIHFVFAVSIFFFSFSTAFGDETRPSSFGGGIGSIISEKATTQQDSGISTELTPQISSTVSNQLSVSASQLVDLYVLQSFSVTYDSGLVFNSGNAQFMGDMAITKNNTMWQRIAVSGYPTIVASGPFSISDDSFTVYNDLAPVNSVGNWSWDGTYLTTVVRFTSIDDPFTEIDIWKRDQSSPVRIITPDQKQAVEDFVTRFYQLCLNRNPDAAGLQGWTNDLLNQIQTGADVANGFIYSPEFINKNTTNDEYLTILYKAFFNRDADQAGWDVWIAELNSGKDRGYVLNGFLGSQEFINLCEDYGINPN